MTKKQYKAADYRLWETTGNNKSIKYFDRKLDKLLYQAARMDGMVKMTHYVVSSPMPPWAAKQEEGYLTTVTRHRFSKEIAEELIADKGAFAHLYVLEEIESKQSKALNTAPMWRDVLTWLDELGGDDARGSERGDNPRPRPEQADSTDDHR